jgi:hypothetical protein
MVIISRAWQPGHKLELARPIAVADPGVLEAQYALAETYAGLGELSEICASDTHSGPQQRVRSWTDARDWYQRSLNTWQGIPNPAMRTPVGFACDGPKTADTPTRQVRGGTGHVQATTPERRAIELHSKNSEKYL